MRTLLFLCGLCCFSASSALAQTYRWQDPATGRTVFSDQPPPSHIRNVQEQVLRPATPPAPDSSYAVKRASEKFPVRLYTSADCTTQCVQARELLNRRGVPFSEKMVHSQADVDELKKLLNGEPFVPSLSVGAQVSRGLESGAWNNLLDLAGYPKTAPYASKPSGAFAQ